MSVSAEGTDAVLRVADEGSGIDPDLLPHIFDLFVQADDTIDRSQGGLGIGLTLVRRLVELHGGTVEASSDGKDPGLHVHRAASGGAAARGGDERRTSRSERRRPGACSWSTTMPTRARCTAWFCQADGHEVYEAGDGIDALAVFQRARPDVAIVDIGLPGMDGYELARRIRSEAGRAET